MRQIYKYVLLLSVINILLFIAVLLLKSLVSISLYLNDFVFLSLTFSLISALTLAIFFRGHTREPDSQAMHTLVSLSVKFLLDMILALIWFFILKKTSLTSVCTFFVLYLTFTIITLFVILNILRTKSL
jgi:hypothetical protein